MSLFKVLEMWNCECGSEEDFDIGCMAIADIDNSSDKLEKIITGSQSGILRIYKPHITNQEESSQFEFSPDDLLLETQLKFPILHVGVGLLSSTSSLLHLAVLHPFKLSVYSVSGVKGSVEHGLQTKVSLIYEHTLKRHAFSLVIGRFGGIQGKDMLCIQFLDGTLSFFEQERFSFSRFLPKSLLPGPLCYVNKTDSFVTVNGFAVESYRFQTLASATDESSDTENMVYKGKRVAPEWTYTLVDCALDITAIEDKVSPTIVILGERCLSALNSHGSLKFFKKFTFTPKCFFCYKEENHGSLLILIATCNETLLVYHETQLKWAAHLNFHPICIRRIDGTDVKGVLALLSESGRLSCCYLGTDPQLGVIRHTEQKTLDFQEAEEELKRLKNIIKSSNQSSLGTQKLGCEITLSMSVSQSSIHSEMSHTTDKILGPSYPVKVCVKCRMVVHDVRLMFHVELPLKVTPNVFVLGSVAEGTQVVGHVRMEAPYVPTTLHITAQAVYINSYGAPRIVSTSALLPMNAIARICPPVKEGDMKLTLDINKKLPLLSELFTDLSSDSSLYPGGAMGIEYHSGHTVSVVPSKTAQRYRLQSDTFPALWLCVSELVRRLQHKFRKDSKLACHFSGSLPLQEYFAVIEEHFTNRQVVEEVEQVLSERALQFRVVQKRLLTKLKDSTPSPLNNLDTLLEATHRQIVSVTETLERHQRALESSCCSLSSATQLILLLVKLTVTLTDHQWAFLSACFSAVDASQSWEERVHMSLIHLLKNCLEKGEDGGKYPEMRFEPLKDITKLKKYISLVLDKVLKNTPFNITESYFEASNTNENEEEEPERYQYVEHHQEDASNGNFAEPDYYMDDMEKAFEDTEEEMII